MNVAESSFPVLLSAAVYLSFTPSRNFRLESIFFMNPSIFSPVNASSFGVNVRVNAMLFFPLSIWLPE